MSRRIAVILTLFLGCIDWIGRAFVAEDVLNGRLATVADRVVMIIPIWLTPVLIATSIALVVWDIWDRRRAISQRQPDTMIEVSMNQDSSHGPVVVVVAFDVMLTSSVPPEGLPARDVA